MSSETYYVYVIVLRFRKKENQWTLLPRSIHTCTTGKIIAIEHDHDYGNEIDSFWNYDDKLKIDKEIINQIFVLDSQLNLT